LSEKHVQSFHARALVVEEDIFDEGFMAESKGATAITRLAANQRKALESLAGSKSITATAKSAGVSRTTIYCWLQKDPNFRATYNQWRDQLCQSSQSRLLMLSDKAVDAVEKAPEAGDARTALVLLKGMGMIAPPQIGQTDPQEVQERMELEEQRRRTTLRSKKGRAMVDEMTADLG
jgi:DNA-binding phage protein